MVQVMAELNILPLISKALAVKSDFREEIDQLFFDSRARMHGFSLTDEIFENRFFRDSDLETEICARKVAALLRLGQQDPEMMARLHDLCHRAYRDIWRYVATNKNITMQGIKRLADVGTVEDIRRFGMLCYMAMTNGNTLPLEDERFKRIFAWFSALLEAADVGKTAATDGLTVTDKKARDIFRMLDRFTGGGFPDSVMKWRTTDVYRENMEMDALEDVLVRDGTPLDVVNNIRITGKDVEQAIRSFILHVDCFEDDQETAVDVMSWFASVVPAIAFARAYSQAREVAISYVDQMIDMADKDAMERELVRLREENRVLRDQAQERQEKLNPLQLENDRLRVQLADMKEAMDDIQEETDLLAEIAKQGLFPMAGPEPCDLSRYRVVIAGGHESWQRRIKEAYPSVTVIEAENFDPAVIEGCDVIAYNWIYGSHKLYYKLIRLARANKKKIIYISNNNLDFFRRAMNCT